MNVLIPARARDLVAFVGLAPLLLLVLPGTLLLVGEALLFAGAVLVVAGPVAIVPLALGGAGLFAAVALVRSWWWLLATDRPLPFWAAAGNWLGLVMASLSVAVGLHLHAAKPSPTWTSQECWMLEATLCAVAASVLLLALQRATPRAMSRSLPFKAVETLLFGAAWVAAATTVPALQQRAVDRAAAIDAATAKALRVETASHDPFIVALCHDDGRESERAMARMQVSAEAARDAWTCIPDNIAQYLHQFPGEYGLAESRVMIAKDAVYWNDRRLFAGTRNGAPCNAAEMNLLRRIVDVVPTELIQLNVRGVPTDCVEDDAARTPIWWRISRHWPAGTSMPGEMREALHQGGVKLDQQDANGNRWPFLAGEKAASAP